jgi:hypothetical protein
MSHKTIAAIALVMAFVFGAMIVVYPLLFNPETPGGAQTEVTPEAPAVN